MRLSGFAASICALLLVASLAGCTSADNANSNTTVTTNTAAPGASPTPAAQNLVASAERPQSVKDKATAMGEADTASPRLAIVTPTEGQTITGSTVRLKLNLSGDLKGYKPGKDPATGMGPHIHVILDNQPYEAYYNLAQPFELRNVSEGKHTIRVFASRAWHESYKNEGNFQIVTFTVKGGGDASKPTTTNTGQVMANNNAAKAGNTNTGAAPAEGKDMAASSAGDVDPKKPLLTYSRPKGEYKGADADAIMIDFWLTNAKLVGDGGQYRVRYSVDGGEAKMLDKWQPIWLTGWANGKHSVKLELVDQNGNVVANGDYNSTTRDITVQK